MTLIKKISLDGVENMELFLLLKDDSRKVDIPTMKVLGQKVYDDCVVSE